MAITQLNASHDYQPQPLPGYADSEPRDDLARAFEDDAANASIFSPEGMSQLIDALKVAIKEMVGQQWAKMQAPSAGPKAPPIQNRRRRASAGPPSTAKYGRLTAQELREIEREVDEECQQISRAVDAQLANEAAQHLRRRADEVIRHAKRDGVHLSESDAYELLNENGTRKYQKRVADSEQASNRAVEYCEEQREWARRHVPFHDAFAYYMGYRPELP